MSAERRSTILPGLIHRSQYYPETIWLLALAGTLWLALAPAELRAQTPPPPVGTVNPRAIGKPVQQPPPIGGLRTVPLGGSVPTAPRHGHHKPIHGLIPLRVIDAPLLRGGAVVISDDQQGRALPAWLPTADPPRWEIDSVAPRVDAWRDIIVYDTLCNALGTCIERRSRLRARWNAFCSCYLFGDALGRAWRVE